MALTIFDLDNTLITNDSDFLWGQFLVDNRIVDPATYEQKNRQFFEDYEKGCLDIDSYLRFSLLPLSQHAMSQLIRWREQFIKQIIQPIIAPGTAALLAKHRQRGDTLMIISATNLFITQPVADLLEIPHILATEPEISNGAYTGNYIGIPTFQQGKVDALQVWMEKNTMDLSASYFYSDSHNDLPLLKLVDNPVAVNPDPELLKVATQQNWPVLDLR
jgi:HAD superfamily hydrolase (TIGR01490 family)